MRVWGVLAAVLVGMGVAVAHADSYAVAKTATPVLNVPDFRAVFGGKDRQTLHTNPCGLIKEVEYVAYPGTPFTILQKIKSGKTLIYKVATHDYPMGPEDHYYIDSRFVTPSATLPTPRPQAIPSKKEVLARLQATAGNGYIWGGDVAGGVPDLVQFYPPKQSLAPDSSLHQKWILNGYDCSGILYEATYGATPRNTSGLVTWGESVPIAGLTAKQIARRLKPLDLIVWKGHVMIVMDQRHLIESRPDYDEKLDGCQDGGVKIRALVDVLEQTLITRVPVNSYDDPVGPQQKKFVVRRWHPEAL